MCLSGTKDLVRVGGSGRWLTSRSPFDFKNQAKHSENQWNFSQTRHLSVRMIVDMVGINRETVWQTSWKKRPNLWKNKVWMLNQDNAPAHNAICSRSFFPINTFEYLTILHICGFSTLWLFLYTKVKSVLKRTHFPSVEVVKAKTAQLLNGLGVEEL